MANPKIITRTVRDLRRYAAALRANAQSIEQICDELDAEDARETRPDPSKRRRKGKKGIRRKQAPTYFRA